MFKLVFLDKSVVACTVNIYFNYCLIKHDFCTRRMLIVKLQAVTSYGEQVAVLKERSMCMLLDKYRYLS